GPVQGCLPPARYRRSRPGRGPRRPQLRPRQQDLPLGHQPLRWQARFSGPTPLL
ncbi:hypothetical protein OC844_008026, partial [Tilletia horrida]